MQKVEKQNTSRPPTTLKTREVPRPASSREDWMTPHEYSIPRKWKEIMNVPEKNYPKVQIPTGSHLSPPKTHRKRSPSRNHLQYSLLGPRTECSGYKRTERVLQALRPRPGCLSCPWSWNSVGPVPAQSEWHPSHGFESVDLTRSRCCP